MKGKLFRYLGYMLLFAMIAASIPLHQIFHKHTNSSSYSLSKDQAGFKTSEKSCSNTLQILPSGILISFLESSDIIENCSLVVPVLPDNFISQLQLFLNKAPPVVLA
jgi:hypothetical protein